MPTLRKSWPLSLESGPRKYRFSLAEELRAGGAWRATIQDSAVHFTWIDVPAGRATVAVRDGIVEISDQAPHVAYLSATISWYGLLWLPLLYDWFGQRLQAAIGRSAQGRAVEV